MEPQIYNELLVVKKTQRPNMISKQKFFTIVLTVHCTVCSGVAYGFDKTTPKLGGMIAPVQILKMSVFTRF